MERIFVTGISTEVGKTIVAAIITEALKADYWKPVQAGDLDNSDLKRVKKLVSNKKTKFHPSSYELTQPMSPHAAADLDKVSIDINRIERPKTKNTLVIEGAGGLLVPLNNENTILDLIKPEDHVVVVSRHYLGSINHTLLTLEKLLNSGHRPLVIFDGDEYPSTETIIKKMGNCFILGRIDNEPYFDQNVIKEYSEWFASRWKSYIKQ